MFKRVECLLLGALLGKRDAPDIEQQRLVSRVKNTTSAGRHRADCIAMIGVFERQDARPPLARILPIPERHLQRDFDRRRAAIGKENMREAARRDFDQSAGNCFRRFMRKARENQLIQLVGLLLNGAHDPWMTMAVGNNPP